MIFLTLGTHEQPFERAVDAVLAIGADEDIVIQYGHSPAPGEQEGVTVTAFMDYDDMQATIDAAQSIICHAGVGTIMTALRAGKTPVVIPRLKALGEHVDDHQLQITRGFAEEGLVVPFFPGDDLDERLAEARWAVSRRVAAGTSLRLAVSAASTR